MPRHKLTERAAWMVRIQPHTIDGRYVIPEMELIRYEASQVVAMQLAITEAHVAAEVPPWKPYARITARHMTAERTVA